MPASLASFHLRPLQLLLLALPLAACSDDAPPAGPDAGPEGCTVPASMRLFPMAMGASWTYSITDPADPTRPAEAKTSTIETNPEDVGDRKAGILAYRIKTEKLNGVTVSWQEDRCTSVVRHREITYDLSNPPVKQSDQFYQPEKPRVDETRTTAGTMWTISYTEIEVPPTGPATTVAKDENWSVVAAGEMVTVPAGTFTTVHYHKLTSGAAEKDYWWAAGVGKIKETGEQDEVLTAYHLP